MKCKLMALFVLGLTLSLANAVEVGEDQKSECIYGIQKSREASETATTTVIETEKKEGGAESH